MKFLKSRDCYSRPEDVYRVAKARGMDLVTITDHDSIDGCLEFLDRHPDAADFFISEEVSCRFPGTTLDVHLGVYGMTERLHGELQPLRAQRLRRVARRCARHGVFFASTTCCISIAARSRLATTCGCSTRCRRSRRATARCWPRTTSSSTTIAARPVADRPRARPRRRQRCAHAAPHRPDLDRPRPATPPRSSSRAWPRPERRRRQPRHCAVHRGGRLRRDRQLRRQPARPRPARSLRARHRAVCLLFSAVSLPVPVPAVRHRHRGQACRGARGTPRCRARLNESRCVAPTPVRRGAGMSRRIAITGIGLVTALGSTREESWRRAGGGRVRDDAADGVRVRGVSQPDRRPRSRWPTSIAPLTPLERRRLSRGDRFGVVAAQEAIDDAGFLDGVDPARVGVLLGAGTSDLLRNERLLPHRDHARVREGPSVRSLESLLQHAGGHHRRALRLRRGCARCVVAACSSSTIAIGQAADAIRSGRLDVALTGGTDALARLTFSGFNALRLMDQRAVPSVRPGPRRHEHRRRGRRFSCSRRCRARRGARRARSTASWPATASACEAFHPTAPEPDGRPVAAVDRGGAARRAARRGRRRSRQRARHRDAAERSGGSARLQDGASATRLAACRSPRSSR